jgi:ubiquinone/menaquinone biosynthesis C-methylase UbiE
MVTTQNLLHADGFTYNSEPSDIVQRLLTISSPKSAIDIGAGAGRNVSFLIDNNSEVTAVECGPESLKALHDLSKQKPKLHVMNSTLQELFIDNQFDAVLCNMTLHFLRRDEIDKAILKLKSLTSLNGFICISSYINCPENNTLPINYTFTFEPNELLDRFADWDIIYYVEDYPVPSARVLNSGVNGGKGFKSARLIAQKIKN